MCYRYYIEKLDREYIQFMRDLLKNPPKIKPNFNVAPTQRVPIIRVVDGKLVCDEVRWGLYENWWEEKLNIKKPMFNARSEKVFGGGLYKHSAKSRRCLVVASGWYEWKEVKGRDTGDPYALHWKRGGFRAFAGIWTTRYTKFDKREDNFAVITTDPNPVAKKIHDRMPVILNATQAKAWIDSDYKDFAKLESFLVPYKGKDVKTHQVSDYVNSVRNTGPQCLVPV